MSKHIKYFIATLLFLSAAGSLFAQYDRDVFFYRGRVALADGKYAQSIENFNILARLDSTDHLTYFYRGIAKYNLGDIRGARKDFNTSVRLNPIFTAGYHYRGITESRFGDYDKALADIEKALTLRPGNEGLYYSRGVTYFLAQQFDKAVEDFNKFIRRQPRDPSAYLNRGACYLYLRDTTKALTDYNKAIKLDRYEPEGFIRRGRLYAEQGKYDEALSDMNRAIDLDSTSTLAYFNRALIYYDRQNFNAAMADLNKVLEEDPGNALTLYNRSLIYAQVGDFENALSDMDRVININPGNVLAYYNRASYFMQMERWEDAIEDYSKAIELYPDFAKAYMNRSYAENMTGDKVASKDDYDTAQQKVAEYRETASGAEGSFADTTKKYSSLLALDADFARKDFDNELLQHRDIDIRLAPMYRFGISETKQQAGNLLSNSYENALVDKFIAESPVPLSIGSSDSLFTSQKNSVSAVLFGRNPLHDGTRTPLSEGELNFLRALYEISGRQYNTALSYYNSAVSASDTGKYESLYHAFYLMNRGVLRSDMIDFIASMESNVQTLSMDDKGSIRTRVREQSDRSYDYSEAIADMAAAAEIVPDIPYIHFNLGNLYCLSSRHVEAIESYSKAVALYPYMGDAYYNRGLVLIYLKDKEKGCIDLSHAGELGVKDAYSVIGKYCKEDEN